MLSSLKNLTPLIDVRAPIEFKSGALPNSVNLPILFDDERDAVGKIYKKNGNQAAVEKGYELVSGTIKQSRVTSWIDFIKEHPDTQLYCARGGQRSQIAQAWLKEAGYEIDLIPGGFKALRNICLTILDEAAKDNKKWIIISGRTGSGKTKLINVFDNAICLESLANHRGSAFGGFNTPQPTSINFENSLACDYLKISDNTVIFEDESRAIGRLVIPDKFFQKMSQSKIVLIEEPIENRIQNIFEEYIQKGLENKTDVILSNELKEKLAKISKRLGGANYKKVDTLIQSAFENQDHSIHFEWIELLLTSYYDRMYDYQLERKQDRCIKSGNWEMIRNFLNNSNQL